MLLEEEGGKIKPANYKHDYTEDQVKEIIKCTNDPIYFIENYVWIIHPKKGRVRFILHDFQKRLINTYHDNMSIIAMLSRQVGKTTTAAGYLLWWLIFKDDQYVLITSKDQDGADEIMTRLWFAYEELPWWIKPGVTKDAVKTKKFDNNSVVRALATTKTTGRGTSPSLVYLDEFAYVRPGIATPFWTSLSAAILSNGGKCIITSTPNTDEDKFANIWFNCEMSPESDEWHDQMMERSKLIDDNDEDYATIYEDPLLEEEEINLEDDDDNNQNFVGFHVHWEKVPGPSGGFRDKKFKKLVLASGYTTEDWMREYECSFVTGDSTLIAASRLAAMRQFMRKPRFVDKHGVRWYEEIRPNMAYGVILDPSEGVGQDDACIQVWEIPSMKQVAEWNTNEVDQVEQTKMLRRVLQRLYLVQQNHDEHLGDVNIYYSVERNGLGIGVLNAIEYENEGTFPGWLIDSTASSINVRGSAGGDLLNRYRGLLTSVSSKKRYCIELKNLIERNLFIPRSQFMISQLKTFVKQGVSYKAKEGTKDDIVMSAVLMCHLIEELRYYEPDLDDMIRPNLDGEYDPRDDTHPDNQAFLPIV